MPVSVFPCLSFAEKEYQRESKWNKTFAMIFLGPEDTQETWSASQRSLEVATSHQGTPTPCVRSSASWAPTSSSGLLPKLPWSLMSRKKSPKSFVAFGLRLLLYSEKLKIGQKNSNWHWALS